jgi:hypothetical protein
MQLAASCKKAQCTALQCCTAAHHDDHVDAAFVPHHAAEAALITPWNG